MLHTSLAQSDTSSGQVESKDQARSGGPWPCGPAFRCTPLVHEDTRQDKKHNRCKSEQARSNSANPCDTVQCSQIRSTEYNCCGGTFKVPTLELAAAAKICSFDPFHCAVIAAQLDPEVWALDVTMTPALLVKPQSCLHGTCWLTTTISQLLDRA